MPDYFALLNEPRSPWLDAESVRGKFAKLAAEHHPDRVHQAGPSEKSAAQQRFTELNAACNCLCDTKARLQYLIELETGAKPSDLHESPPAMTELFFEVAKLCREADGFIALKERTTSPMLKVQLLEQAEQWRERLSGLQARLATMLQAIQAELESLSPAWISAASITTPERRAVLPLARLEDAYRLWSFVSRWNAQLQERGFKLTL